MTTGQDGNGLYSFKQPRAGNLHHKRSRSRWMILTTSSAVVVTTQVHCGGRSRLSASRASTYISGMKYQRSERQQSQRTRANRVSSSWGHRSWYMLFRDLAPDIPLAQVKPQTTASDGAYKFIKHPARHLQGQRDLKDRLDPDRAGLRADSNGTLRSHPEAAPAT